MNRDRSVNDGLVDLKSIGPGRQVPFEAFLVFPGSGWLWSQVE